MYLARTTTSSTNSSGTATLIKVTQSSAVGLWSMACFAVHPSLFKLAHFQTLLTLTSRWLADQQCLYLHSSLLLWLAFFFLVASTKWKNAMYFWGNEEAFFIYLFFDFYFLKTVCISWPCKFWLLWFQQLCVAWLSMYLYLPSSRGKKGCDSRMLLKCKAMSTRAGGKTASAVTAKAPLCDGEAKG